MKNIFTSFTGALLLFHLTLASMMLESTNNILRYKSDREVISPSQSESAVLTNTCSGLLNTTTGGIAYKAYERIEQNERCVWTIRGGVSNGFTLNLLTIGFLASNDTQLIASCMRFRNGITHDVLNQTGPVNGVSSCDVILLTFSSGVDIASSTGFVLEYASLRPGSISSESVDYIVNASEGGFIKHPVSAPQYTNMELSTFVFMPSNIAQASRGSTSILYIKDSLDPYYCYDHIRVLRFNASSTLRTKWQDEGLICQDTASELIVNQDIILITFDTNMELTGAGFQFAFAESSYSQCG